MQVVEIRFSRHAKNKLRLYVIDAEEINEVIVRGEKTGQHGRWESRYRRLRVIWITVGDYILVITIIRTK
jgi:hypothetical protein